MHDTLSKRSESFSFEQYRTEGYTGPVRVMGPEEAGAARRSYFAAIGQSEDSPGPTDVRPGGFNLHHRWAYELCVHDRTLDYVERILGPDIVLWAMAFWYKEPHNEKYIPWHQDAVYWPMQPRINLTAWVALGPTRKENGCLRLIPGSHRRWLDDEYRPAWTRKSAFAEGLGEDQVDESKALDLEMAPGECVFFTEATLHGSTRQHERPAAGGVFAPLYHARGQVRHRGIAGKRNRLPGTDDAGAGRGPLPL